MKNGVIKRSFSIDSNHIDSIIFYSPKITTTSTGIAIGDTHQGSIVFYLDVIGGGLIAAL